MNHTRTFVRAGLLVLLLGSTHLAHAQQNIVLPASEAQIAGTAIMENGGQNIGVWKDATDVVRWLALITAPGKYRVQLVYSLAPGEAGSTISVAVNDKTFSVKAESTKSWTDYQPLDMGEITIAKVGAASVTVKATDKPTPYVINIKSINLVPLEVQATRPAATNPGVVSVAKDALGAKITMGNGLLELRPLLDGAIRVRFSDRDTPQPLPNLVLLGQVPTPKFTLKQDKTGVIPRHLENERRCQSRDGRVDLSRC